jgi:uncharacterized protein
MSQPIVWLSKEQLNERKKQHSASVIVGEDGAFHFESERIITPKGLEKENKLISVMPAAIEKVVSLNEVKYLFKELKQMNLILTNACNLSCGYCYEQHNKDYGRFTSESLLKAYKFLLNSNSRQSKVFQFFGGEPLIHKDVILDFIKKNKKELSENAKGDNNTIVSIITNGLLLSKELIDEYLSYDFTFMLISLDTDKAEIDHREIGQDKIDTLLEMIRYIPTGPKEEKRITIRCTLSRETAPDFKLFVDNLYERGIRRMIVHPLVLDSSKGFIQWNNEEWDNLHKDISYVLDKYNDLQIHFTEGVGQKGEDNCMIGSDMIAIDASGDFSGCYFFTNQKAGAGNKAILGNIFNDKIYIDRYKGFQTAYSQMFEQEEQCQTCDYKNACYQCPAGNLDTGSRIFRPDDMCQKIVKLAIDLQEDITKKQTRKKYDILCNSINSEGENITFTKALSYLMFFSYFNYHPKNLNLIHSESYDIDDYRKLLTVWKKIIENKNNYNFTVDNFAKSIKSLITDDVIEIEDFYYYIIDKSSLAPGTVKIKLQNEYQRAFILTLLHLVILQISSITHEGTFSENLVNKAGE